MNAPLSDAIFSGPVLSGLDGPGRRELSAAGSLIEIDRGDSVYALGDDADDLFVVLSGRIELVRVVRGETASRVVRALGPGACFGEEASVEGCRRSATARAAERARLVRVPYVVLRRLIERQGGRVRLEREQRRLRRALTRDALSSSMLGKLLDERALDMLLDEARLETCSAGGRVYAARDSAAECFTVVDGIVKLVDEAFEPPVVRAYLSAGDLFGEEVFVRGAAYRSSARALGPLVYVRLPQAALLSLELGNVSALGRISRERQSAQAPLLEDQAKTSFALRDVYRLETARSLLAIDQDACVRCGHCAWTCENTHGVSRLSRRGEKVLVTLSRDADRSGPASLLLPSSCQHCKQPVCMIECPTGAIGRDASGDVFIREELCTGCGACAKACPWDNIQMAERDAVEPTEKRSGTSALLAVKCDLCRGRAGPACVDACPTGAIARVEPRRDFVELRRLLDQGDRDPAGSDSGEERLREPGGLDRSRLLVWVLPASFVGVLAGIRLHAVGVLAPERGLALAFGVLAALACLAALSYALFKRAPDRLRRFLRIAPKAAAASGRTHYVLHLLLGTGGVVAVAAHAGARFPESAAGALHAAFWLSVALGALVALFYRVLPRRLNRLETRGVLPEDLPVEERALLERIERETSGTDPVVKALVVRVLLPYVRSPFSLLRLGVSGRSLKEERTRLLARLSSLLGSERAARRAELEPIVKTAVELRALGLRRGLSFALKSLVPVHVILACAFMVLLVLHVAGAVLG